MKRNKLEIIRDILQIIQSNHGSTRITPLIRKSNISTTRFQSYYRELLQKGMIKEHKKNSSKTVLIEEKGKKFLEKYKSIINFIEEFEL